MTLVRFDWDASKVGNSDDRYDVVVVGAGVIGASSAFHLSRRGMRVLVVEARSGPAEGSTGLSFASVRGQWAEPLNIQLAWSGIQAYRDFERRYGIDVGYRATGYLFLVPEEHWEAQVRAVELQRSYGVPVELLSLPEAQQITTFEAAGLAGATWGTADGQVDPHAVTRGYLELARAAGAQVRFKSSVQRLTSDHGDGWEIVAGGRTVRARYLVNAAGGWAGEVAAQAGLRVPVTHSRRNVYASASGALERTVPMTVDLATGVYLRSEGDRLLFGAVRPDEIDGYNLSVDWGWMESVLETAIPRFPWLAEMPLDRAAAWAGTYENSPDHCGIVGPMPEASTWINACGFSGHGLMQAPAVGSLVAEQIGDGAITSVDASPLAIERFSGDVDHPRTATSLVF